MIKYIFICLLFLLLSFSSHSTILNVPAIYPTIQMGLNACNTGDTVVVQPGLYYENIIWPNQTNIKLFSAGDSSNTILNGGNLDAVLVFDSGLMTVTIDSNTVVQGFKITCGGSNSVIYCGGIVMYSCNPKFNKISICENYLGISASESSYIICNSSGRCGEWPPWRR